MPKRSIIRKKHLHYASRLFWGIVLGLIIALAIIVQLGRQAFPLLNDYREVISEKLGDSLGVIISVDKVDAKWSGLKPEIKLLGVKLTTLDSQPIFDVSQASAELSIVSSLLRRNLSWRRITFNDFNSTIVQQTSGRWEIPGYEFADTDEDQKFRIDDPFDLFLFGRRVEINNANLHLHFRSGRRSLLSIPRIALENDRYFHRLKADISLDENDQAFSLVIEGYGDPRTDDDFNAKGFLNLQNFPTEKVAAVFGVDNLNPVTHDDIAGVNNQNKKAQTNSSEVADEWDQNQRLDVNVWFSGSGALGMSFEGSFDARGMDGERKSIPQIAKMKLPKTLAAKFQGEWRTYADWFVDVQDASVSWAEDAFTVDRMSFYGEENSSGEPEIGLRLDAVDLDLLSQQVIFSLHDAYPNVKKVITSLSLKGMVRPFGAVFKSKEEGFFLAQGIIENGSVNAFLGSPEIKNVNGYFESSLIHGALRLSTDNSFSLFLPKVYSRPMVFQTAAGIMDWRVDIESKFASINSSQLTVTNSDEIAHGLLNLHLPFKREFGESIMNLVIGAEKTNAIYHAKYIPERVSAPLRNWLSQSIKGGDLSGGAFLFRGSLNKNPSIPFNLQLAANVANVQLAFDPGWPQVENISGQFRLDNKDLDIQLDQGFMLGAKIESAAARLVRTSPGNLDLAIDVNGKSTARQGQNIVANSALPEALKKVFDGWEVKGDIAFDSKFTIPLKSKIQVGYDIDLGFDSLDLRLVDLSLPLEKLSGKINISSDSKVFAKKITGQVFKQDFEAQIFSDITQGFMGVDIKTIVDMLDLNNWLKRPELQFVEGQTEVVGRIHIPIGKDNENSEYYSNVVTNSDGDESLSSDVLLARSRRYPARINDKRAVIAKPKSDSSVMLALASSLSGIRLNAPAPLAKTPEETRQFSSIITLGPDSTTYRFVLGEQIAALLSNSKDKGVSLGVAVNDTSSTPFLNYRSLFDDDFRKAQTISVFGSAADIKLTDWLSVKDVYFSYKPDVDVDVSSEIGIESKENGPEELLITEVDLDVKSLELGGMTFSDLNVGGVSDREKWMFDLLSDEINGKVFLYNNQRPMNIALVKLKLPRKFEDDLGEVDSVRDDFAIETIEPGTIEAGTIETQTAEIKTKVAGDESFQVLNQEEIQKKSILADVNLDSLPDMTISVGELVWGEEEFGRWSFDFSKTDTGIKIDNLLASVKGLDITGVPEGVLDPKVNPASTSSDKSVAEGKMRHRGAQFLWDNSAQGHKSRFVGQLDGKNLGAILQAWGQEKLLDAEDIRIRTNMSWAGAPDELTLEKLQGQVKFQLDDGSFIRGAEVGENPLIRLFALLNFDTLARRLRLDFSDLAARGFAFDKVDGDVSFDSGVLYLTQPITVVSSTSTMQLAGTVDLVNEGIDAELVATLPVASNVAFATAFVAGLPAALGVYVIGKLFKEQVDKASSINYGITGDWSDPKLRVKEVFNDTAAKKKGKQTKEKLDAKDVESEEK